MIFKINMRDVIFVVSVFIFILSFSLCRVMNAQFIIKTKCLSTYQKLILCGNDTTFLPAGVRAPFARNPAQYYMLRSRSF